MLLAATQAAEAKTAKAKIDPDYKTVTLEYNSHINSNYMFEAQTGIEQLLLNSSKKATYTAVIKNKKVAKFINNKNDLLTDKKVIAATGTGTTTATIYEKKSGEKKKTKIGTVKIRVKKAKLADVYEDIIDWNDKGPEIIWLKLNLKDRHKECDFASVLHNEILNASDIGAKFKKSEYTAAYRFVLTDEDGVVTDEEDTKAAEFIDLSGDGRLSAKATGETHLHCDIEFSDGSREKFDAPVKVTDAVLKKTGTHSMSNIRDSVVGLNTPVELTDGTKKPMINFDNAATTPALEEVQDAVNQELELYGSIGRGSSQKSAHSTKIYNDTREKVLEFVGADPQYYTCFYVNNTTDGLNKLASALITSKKDLVLATRMEHHANDLSWRERCKVIYAEVDDYGRIQYDEIERLLKAKKGKVKYVTVTAASNVTGYVTDVHRVAALAHKYGAKIIVDGAQIVAHRQFSMIGDTDAENIDFLVFSAHKMYSPYGGGAVVGLSDVLNKHMPTFYGGGTIKIVADNWQHYADAPARYEAGSPNYPGVVGLGKAVEILHDVGFEDIQAHEKVLNTKLIDGLKKQPNVIIYGDSENIDDRVGVVTFNFTDINSLVLADKLSEMGAIATRRGAFCAHPYVWRLMGIPDSKIESFESCTDGKTPGMIRVSFGIYNTEKEVDEFLEILPKAMEAAKEAQKDMDVDPAY